MQIILLISLGIVNFLYFLYCKIRVFDIIFFSGPIIFLVAQWGFFPPARFVFLFSVALLSSILVVKIGLPKNRIAIGLCLLSIYSISTSFLSYYQMISALKGISLFLLAGFLLFVPAAIQMIHPQIGTRTYILRMYLFYGAGIVITNGIYFFVDPSSSNEYFSGSSFYNERFRGYFVNPNDLAAFYGIYFVPIFWFIIEKKKILFEKLGLFLLFFLAIIQLIATQSRAGIISCIVALCIFIFGNLKGFLRAMSIFTIIIVFTGFYAENPNDNFIRNFIFRNEIYFDGSGRIPVWEETFDKIMEKPVFGGGLGVSRTQQKEEMLQFNSDIYTIQKGNSYLGALEELGLVGIAILFGALLIPILKLSWKGLLSNQINNDKNNLLIIAVVAGGLVNAMFEAWLLSVGNFLAFSFWMFASLLLNSKRDSIEG